MSENVNNSVTDEELSEFMQDSEINQDANDARISEPEVINQVEGDEVVVVPVEPATEVKPEGDEPVESVSGDTSPEPIVGDGDAAPVAVVESVTLTVAQHEALLNKIEELSGTPTAKEPPATAPATNAPVAELSTVSGLPEYLESIDFDSIMASKENFIQFMLGTMAKVQEQTAQKVLTSIPQVVGNFVQQQTTMRDVATEFYARYPELKRFKRYVSRTADEIASQHADWNIVQVLDEAAKVAKETLNLQAAVTASGQAKVAKPTLPGQSGVKTPTKAPSGLQKELDDFMND